MAMITLKKEALNLVKDLGAVLRLRVRLTFENAPIGGSTYTREPFKSCSSESMARRIREGAVWLKATPESQNIETRLYRIRTVVVTSVR